MKGFCKTFLKIGCMLVGLSSTAYAMLIEEMEHTSSPSPVTSKHAQEDSLKDPRQDLRLSPYPVSDGQHLAEIRIGEATPFYLLRTVHFVPLQFALPSSVLYPLVQRCVFGISEMGDGSDSENSSDSIDGRLRSIVDQLGEEYISDFFVTEAALLRHEEKINQFLSEQIIFWEKFNRRVNSFLPDSMTLVGYEQMIYALSLHSASSALFNLFSKARDLLRWDKAADVEVPYLESVPIHPIAMQAMLRYYNSPYSYWYDRGMDNRLIALFRDYSKRVYPLESQVTRISYPALQEVKKRIENAAIAEVNSAIEEVTSGVQQIYEPQQIDAHPTTLPSYVYSGCQQYFDIPLQRDTNESVLHRNVQWVERISNILNETRSAPFLMFVGDSHVVDLLERLSQRYPMRVKWNPDIE